MKEVKVTLQFDQHSLGDCRRKKISRMLRAPNGRVMFLPSWWQALMRYAAQVMNRHHAAVRDIDWDPIIEGTPREYKRFYAPSRYTVHEAFFPGDKIVVHAVVPASLPLEDFSELLRIAGRYKGISPYRKGPYGTFDVVDIEVKGAPLQRGS
jgi:hypothetical protein